MAIQLGSAYGVVKITDQVSGPVKGAAQSMGGLEKSSHSLKGAFSQLSGGLGKTGFDGTLNDLTKEMTGVNLATLGTVAAVGAAIAVIKSSFKDTIKLAESVRYLSRSLGVTAEEASILIQVADDLKIEQSQLEMAFKNAQSKGISPNIAGIKDLQKQYALRPTPIAKAQFATDTFGQRAGPEMQKLLELTGDELDAMAQSARDAGLVMAGEAVQSARDFEIALDDLGDAIEGFKVQLGMGLMPLLTDTLNEMSEISQVWGNWPAVLGVLKKYSGVFGDWGDDLSKAGDGMRKFEADDLIVTLEGVGETAGETAEKVGGIVKSQPQPVPMVRPQRIAAAVGHGLLYLLRLAQPITGWMMSSAAN